MIWLGLFAIIGRVLGASELTYGFFGGSVEEIIPQVLTQSTSSCDVQQKAPSEQIASNKPKYFCRLPYEPQTRSQLLEEAFVTAERSIKFTAAAIPSLRIRVADDDFFDYSKFSLEALNMCLEYQESMESYATLDKKSELLSKLFRLGVMEATRPLFFNSLLHPFCYDALKTLGPAMSPMQMKWLAKYYPGSIFKNLDMLAGVTNFSWMTPDLLNMHLSAPTAKFTLNLLDLPAFLASDAQGNLYTPKDTVIEAIAYGYRPSHYESVKGILQMHSQDIRLYPVLLTVPRSAEHFPADYDFNSNPIIDDLQANGLTKANLAAILAYAQVTERNILTSLHTIARAWCNAHANYVYRPEDNDVETAQSRHLHFNSVAGPALDFLMTIRDHRQALLDAFEGLEKVSENVQKFLPDWKSQVLTILRNPVDFNLRMALFHFSNQSLHVQVHPHDLQAVIPLPRAIFTRPLNGFRMEASPEESFDPRLWNSLLRNVFFFDGESWVDDAVAASVDISSQDKVRTHLREIMKLPFEHSPEKMLEQTDLLNLSMKLRESVEGQVLMGMLAKFYAIESMFPIPADEEGQKCLRKMIYRIHPECIFDADLQLWRIVFASNSELLRVVNVKAEQVKAFKVIDKASYPFYDSLGFTIEDLSEYEKMATNSLSILHELKSFKQRGNEIEAQKRLPRLLSHCQLIECVFLGLGPELSKRFLDRVSESKILMDFLSKWPNTFSTLQINNMLKNEHGREFLKSNPGITCKLKNYSAFSAKDFQEFNLNIRNISGILASLPYDAKLEMFSRRNDGNFAHVAFNLGADFWKSEAVANNADIWKAIDLVTLTVESKKVEVFKMFSVSTNIGSKIQGPIEESFSLILKWIIQQDWLFLTYHAFIQRFAGNEAIINMNFAYRNYLEEEATSRFYLVHLISSSPNKTDTRIRFLEELLKSTLSPLRNYVMNVVGTKHIASMIKSDKNEKLQILNPYDAHACELNLMFSNGVLPETVWKEAMDLAGIDQVFLDKAAILQSISHDRMTGSAAEVGRQLNTLPVMDAAVLNQCLTMFGVNGRRIMLGKDPDRPIKCSEPKYEPPFKATVEVPKTQAKKL